MVHHVADFTKEITSRILKINSTESLFQFVDQELASSINFEDQWVNVAVVFIGLGLLVPESVIQGSR